MPSGAAIRSFLTLLGLVASFTHSVLTQPARARSIETLESIGGLPAHVAGGFTEISTCARSSDGEYLIFFEHDPSMAAGILRESGGRRTVERVI